MQSSIMYLITTAHHGEAQGIIENFQLKKIQSNLYKNEQIVLIITGEGPFEATTMTALTLAKFPISKVINLGIAGSLTPHLKIGDFLKVRTIYLTYGTGPAFKSFPSFPEGVDLITSTERILSPQKALPLKGMGDIVDREAWGVAMASKTAGVKFECYKLISDEAGHLGACELVKIQAQEFSERLALELSSLLNSPVPTHEEQLNLDGFYFTHSMTHQFKKLLKKLSIKLDLSESQTLDKIDLSFLRSQEIPPKERSLKLLRKMEDLIDPTKKRIEENILQLTQEFSNQGFKLLIDPLLENPKATISFEASSDEDLVEKSQQLAKLSLQSFNRLMNGEFHVE
jgi:nucleoside phosphorylase